MTGQRKLNMGLLCAFLSYLIPFPPVRLLLILAAIQLLKEERRDLLLLRPLVLMILIYSLVSMALLRWPLGWDLTFLDLLALAAELYCHFQFLGDLAALAGKYQPSGELGNQIRGRRTLYILLYTFDVLLGQLEGNSFNMLLFRLVLEVLMFAVVVSIVWGLFQLWRYVWQTPKPDIL